MPESIGLGNDLELFECTEDFGKKATHDVVAGKYYYFAVDFAINMAEEFRKLLHSIEISDSQLSTLALQSGSYSFWDNPEEDIYTLSDGSPL